MEALIVEREGCKRQVSELQQQILQLETLIRESGFQKESDDRMIRDLTETQLEMKVLIDQERALYNDDREKLEIDMEKMGRLTEAKIRMIKSKLLGIYEGDFEAGKELSVEDIIERIGISLAKFKRDE